MNSIVEFCNQLNRELRLLPAKRRKEITDRLQADLRLQMEAQGKSEAQICSGLPRPEEMAAEFLNDVEIRPARVIERMLAFTADLMLMLVLPLGLLALAFLYLGESIVFGLAGGLTVLSLIGLLIMYFPISEGTWGQTVGKMLFGLVVVREDGRPISYGQAFIRRLSFWCNLFVIDAIFAFFLPRRQRALDRVAGTVVAKTNRAKPLPISILAGLLPLLIIGTALSLNGVQPPDWLYPNVPGVPAEVADPAAVVQALDLSAYGFTLAEVSQLDYLESTWHSPEGELQILAYKGSGGSKFLREWAGADKFKYVSFSHELGEKFLRKYRTKNMHKFGWRLGQWAFAVEAGRDQFSPDEFENLIAEISGQLENIR